MKEVLKIEKVEGGYAGRKVLRGVNMSLEEGKTALIMGPNGSGKSTLLKVICGVLKAWSGRILFYEKDITGLSTYHIINMGIGYLRQTRNIFPTLTVKDNLLLGGYGLSKKEMEKGMERVFSYFPFLKEKMNLRAGLLSGGEKQMLALGMVLMKEKKVLLLDEPTAGLAPSAAKKVLEEVKKIKGNMSIIIVEHNLKLVADWVDYVNIMRDGEIVDEFKGEDFKTKIKDIEKIFFVAER
jgi:branched-chain amino acid transport system ATP-binding protein